MKQTEILKISFEKKFKIILEINEHLFIIIILSHYENWKIT